MKCKRMHVRNVSHVHKIKMSTNHIGIEMLHLKRVLESELNKLSWNMLQIIITDRFIRKAFLQSIGKHLSDQYSNWHKIHVWKKHTVSYGQRHIDIYHLPYLMFQIYIQMCGTAPNIIWSKYVDFHTLWLVKIYQLTYCYCRYLTNKIMPSGYQKVRWSKVKMGRKQGLRFVYVNENA